jgi:hypothetical protein
MSNPLLSPFGGNPQQNSQPQQQSGTLLGLLNSIRSSPNPNQAAQQLLNSDPRFKNISQYIRQNGGDARTAFYNLAAQKGTDPNAVLSQLM